MIGVGVGVGVGFGGVGKSSSWIKSRVAAAGTLIHDVDMADVVLSGTDVVSLTTKAGVSLPALTADLFSAATLNGRAAIVNSSTTLGKAYGIVAGAAAKTIVLVGYPSVLPFGAIRGGVRSGNDNHVLSGDPGTSNYLTNTGWAHTQNGVATEIAATTPRVIVSVNASNAVGGLIIGGGEVVALPDRTWLGTIARVCSYSDVFDVTALTADLAAYYHITL